MIKAKELAMRNFLSVGNTTQKVRLDQSGLTLVLGENLDQGGGGSRNGVGKTTIVQAIFFAWYGIPLTNIRKDNLINKTNQKQMEVSLEYEVEERTYRIERGRKPNYLRFYVNDGLVNSPETDEGHGESKWTQAEIERSISNLSHNLAKHIVALHTKTTPFLGMKPNEQRDIIEELLGITQLSDKAIQLKDLVKETRDEIKVEEVRIKTVMDGNNKIQNHINDLNFKSVLWDREHQKKLDKLVSQITRMQEVDINAELESHNSVHQWTTLNQEVQRLGRDLDYILKAKNTVDLQIRGVEAQIQSTEEHKCHACGQEVHDTKHDQMLLELREKHTVSVEELGIISQEYQSIEKQLQENAGALSSLGDEPTMVYQTIKQAYEHKNLLDKYESELVRESEVESPYIDQIATLSTSGIQDVSYEWLNELIRLKEHQDFLLKLLTSKDSFIRKKIIDQNLGYLNHRLNHYLEKLALPHEVVFQSDLSVEIMNLGKEYDFDQLSNGESTRLVLSLAWAFRDVWESMNQQFNLMMIDELIDSGMDSQGMDNALEILKKSTRERPINIFLISHKDELVSRVGKILLVQKENGFTNFVTDEIKE
jgi:DNA repair exonuclease SbcCD ATPase subunit